MHTQVNTMVETQMDSPLEDTLEETAGASPASADNAPPRITYTYMFAVCIYDDTACCDAIVLAKEGERLLAGVSAEQLYHDPSLQQACQQKLDRAICEGAKFEFEILTYLTASGFELPPCAAFSDDEGGGEGSLNAAEEQDPDRSASHPSSGHTLHTSVRMCYCTTATIN